MVDDDRMLAEMYRERFKLEGFNIETVANGHEGIKVAKRTAPDLILLDIMMPGTDGWQMLHQLKKDPATKAIPVIVDTALMQDAIKQKAKRMGADELLVKSETTPAKMIAMMNQCLH